MAGKRKAVTQEDVKAALALEQSLFGDDDGGAAVQGLLLAEKGGGELEDAAEGQRRSKKGGRKGKKAAVWEDPEDAKLEVNITSQARQRKLHKEKGETTINGIEYEKRLREQHRKLNAKSSWADPSRKPTAAGEDGEDEEGSAADVLARAGGLLSKGAARTIPAGLLETTRCKDANLHGQTNGVVQSVGFHPNRQLLMTAGLDKKIRLFQVDGIRNPAVQSIFLEDCPIRTAAFSGGGHHIVAAGRRPFFYVYDLAAAKVERVAGLLGHTDKSWESFAVSPAPDSPLMAFLGNQGSIPLVSLKMRQPAFTLKAPGAVRSAAFTPNGHELLSSSDNGLLYLWDLRMQRCVGSQVDDGCVRGTSLAASPDDRLFATGSDAGVVNLYSWDRLRSGRRPEDPAVGALNVKPEKIIMNLTTAVDSLAFSPDGQILAMASRMKKDSLRLLHVPSRTVFSNWPSSRTPLHYVHSIAFSPGGGYLAVGNAKGRALLYRLHHYSEA